MAKSAIHRTRQQTKSRWRRQIRRIQREITYAFHNRIIFREVMRMFRHNPALHQDGATVHDWIVGMYGRDQLMAVRRELDGQSGVINLIKLLHEIEQRPDVITRRGYLRFSIGQDAWVRGRALRHFRELEAVGTTHQDPLCATDSSRMLLASGRPLEGPKLLAIRDHLRHELAGDVLGQVENDLRHGPWIRVAQPYKKKGAAAPFEVLPIVSQLSANDRKVGCGGGI